MDGKKTFNVFEHQIQSLRKQELSVSIFIGCHFFQVVSRMVQDGKQLGEAEKKKEGGARERPCLVGYIFWREANDNGHGNDFEEGTHDSISPFLVPMKPFPLLDAAPPFPLIVKNIGPTGQLESNFSSYTREQV